MELVFNIWFIVDIGTQLSKYAILKPYCLLGSDEEKTQILQKLAESDYLTVEKFDFAERCSTVFENITAEGYLHMSSVNHYFDLNFDFFLSEMEKSLPPIFKYKGGYLGENKAIEQKFPNEPLFVLTFLMENEFGEMKPYTKAKNKAWFQSEKERIDSKVKGIQN